MDKLRIIIFDDENHANKIWIEGKLVGKSDNISYIIKNSVDIIKQLNDDYEIIETYINIWNEFDIEDESLIDYILDYFDNVNNMTEKEVELIQNKDWINLINYIEKLVKKEE